ncbi:glycosyltransferase 61 family protein, partial [Loktanella sp. DJP18]|uniref:glycosyltransferase 61 family protein n=1 Tax=Loktanella sp. DJP18 TaxID=3409788 RepID=UPI003BB6841B
MDDWRKPKTKAKDAFKSFILKGLSISGRFVEVSKTEKKTAPRETVQFYGHRIGEIGDTAVHQETRLAFNATRPDYEISENLSYSENGMGWSGGRLIEKFSVHPLRLADFRHQPQQDATIIATCAIVECDYVYSYGDWTHCYLGTILSADFPDVPVLIPRYLTEKSYVLRDLGKAKINWIATDGWTNIEHAYVLRKRNPLFYWSRHDVIAYRKAFDIEPTTPVPGSITYLGRFDLGGETIHRSFPSEVVAKYITSIGGRVVNQEDLNTETSHNYAEQAEIVIGDHGSGMLNILFWQPKTVIELVVDDWWVNNMIFTAYGMGVENFGVIRVDGLSADAIGELIKECLESFGRTP